MYCVEGMDSWSMHGKRLAENLIIKQLEDNIQESRSHEQGPCIEEYAPMLPNEHHCDEVLCKSLAMHAPAIHALYTVHVAPSIHSSSHSFSLLTHCTLPLLKSLLEIFMNKERTILPQA